MSTEPSGWSHAKSNLQQAVVVDLHAVWFGQDSNRPTSTLTNCCIYIESVIHPIHRSSSSVDIKLAVSFGLSMSTEPILFGRIESNPERAMSLICSCTLRIVFGLAVGTKPIEYKYITNQPTVVAVTVDINSWRSLHHVFYISTAVIWFARI